MASFWVFVVLTAISFYVLLDGFDLGVGILFGLVHDEARRLRMLEAISPVWDGNETWLVMTGAVLFGAFPVVYSAVLSAFYLPICVMLAALIMRGVAFEYRHHAVRMRGLWDTGFIIGSFLVSFIQGAAIGALSKGLPIVDGQYVGTAFGWLGPFSVLCGIGLSLGYALLGAAWLIHKCEGDTRAFAKRIFPLLLGCTFVVLVAVFAGAIIEHAAILQRWKSLSWRYVFPVAATLATGGLLLIERRLNDVRPLLLTMLIFLCALGAFVVSFWPYMIPFSITVTQAQAPMKSLAFMFWGIGIVVFPLTIGYTLMNYFVFRGKMKYGSGY